MGLKPRKKEPQVSTPVSKTDLQHAIRILTRALPHSVVQEEQDAIRRVVFALVTIAGEPK